MGGWGNSRPLPPLLWGLISTAGTIDGWAGQVRAPPTTSLGGSADVLESCIYLFLYSSLSSLSFSHHTDPNLPPPKPKKPPKELVDRYSLSTLSGNSTRGQPLSLEEGAGDTPTSIRSRTMSMFQTLFGK